MFTEKTEECFQNDASICTYNLLSCCTKGRKCSFLHHIPKEQYNIEMETPGQEDPCYFFLKGKCIDGESCQRSHEPPCLNGTIQKVCRYFSQGRCKRGKLCAYLHDLPHAHSPETQSSSFQLENNSNVSPLIINTGDDVQSMAVRPKFCRFYTRGMCFFGDRCTNFHDKPEKDLETFISDLRENEALMERDEHEAVTLDNIRNASNSLHASITNNETDCNVRKISSANSNLTHQQHSKSDQVVNMSSNSEESNSSLKTNYLRVPPDSSFTKVNESTSWNPFNSIELLNPSISSKLILQTETCSSFSKSSEQTNLRSSLQTFEQINPCNPSNSPKQTNQSCNSNLCNQINSRRSSKPKEFIHKSSSSKKFVRTKARSSSNLKFFYGKSKTYSNFEEFEKGTYSFSKSREFSRDPSNSKEFIVSSSYAHSKEFIKSSSIPIKSEDFSRASYDCSRFQSKNFSNVSYSYSTTLKNNFRTQYKSAVRELTSEEQLENADVYLELKKQQSRKKSNQRRPSVQRPIKTEEHFTIESEISDFTSPSKFRTPFTVTGHFNKRTQSKTNNCPMTKKQNKSQRKPKPESVQPRVFFDKLFFKTPVAVTHVTKKL